MSQSDSETKETASTSAPLTQLRRRRARASERDARDLSVLTNHLTEFQSLLSTDERAVFESLIGTQNAALISLGAIPAEDLLEPDERELVEQLLAAPQSHGRVLPSQVALIMKATRYCNLRCTYCRSWSDEPNQSMSFEVLARAIHGALSASGVRGANFIWHGGETTLRPVSFYQKALWLQERFRRPGQKIANTIQTNGTHLNEEWMEFIKRYDLSVGVSLDGPPEIHDRRRIDIAGRPTSERVRAGLEKLQAWGVRYGVLMVVDEDVVQLGAKRMLDYLLSLDVSQVALLNVTPEGDPAEASPDEPYLDYRRFVEYLRELFQLWYPHYVNRISFREISDLLEKLEGHGSGSCVHGPNCVGRFFTIEPMGDVYHCDKYQKNPAFRFGNVLETTLADIPASPVLQRAHGYTAAGLDLCRSCPWFHICQGACPYDRYVRVVRRQLSQDERCCGLSPLLSDMVAAIGGDSRSRASRPQQELPHRHGGQLG